MDRVEFWTSGISLPVVAARQADQAEADEWDGIGFNDSQNLSGDVYVALTLAATTTSNLKIGTGVTNPFTRHAAVTASAIATIQAVSGGRASLGIGRGDSALAHLGLAPAPVSALERYLRQVQTYLRGEDVQFSGKSNVGVLHLAEAPTGSRLEWLRPSQPKVPVHVASTGPRVIRIAALLADRVTFALGADPVRLEWGVATAQAARRESGLAPDIPFGAYVPCVVHDDPNAAFELGEGSLSLFSRFSAMYGTPVGPVTDMQRTVLSDVHRSYDMVRHSYAGSPQAKALTPEFARSFGIFGPPDYCVQRLRQLVDLGIRVFHISGPSAGADKRESERANQRFVEEVMPAVRGASDW